MQTRSVVGVGVALFGIVTMGAGCAPTENLDASVEAEPTAAAAAADEVAGDEAVGTVSQSLLSQAACDYAAEGKGTVGLKEAQKRAAQALKYIRGNTTLGGCNSFKTQGDIIRLAIKAGTFKITSSTYDPYSMACGIPSTKIRLTEMTNRSTRNVGAVWDAIRALTPREGPADTCFGTGTSTFLVLQISSTPVGSLYQSWAELDPSPATLNSSNSSTARGTTASAAAKYSDLSAITLYRWATTGNSCTTAYAGFPCSKATGTLAADSVHAPTLTFYDGTCLCE